MQFHRTLVFSLSVVVLAGCTRDVSSPGSPSARQVSAPRSAVVMAPAAPFLETFDGSPASPTEIKPASWDVSRHTAYFFPMAPMNAMHGADCSPYPATHAISTLDQAFFQCRDHVMTSIYTHGYAEAVLTPNRLVDFTSGEVVVSFDVSTLRTAGRDWFDLWITPYEDGLQLPVDNGTPDLSDAPRRAVQIELPPVFGSAGLDPRYSYFVGRVYNNFAPTALPQRTYQSYPTVLTPSANVRTKFELHISRTHVKFGIPAYNLWWIDADVPDLGWSRATLQLAHHSYHPVEESLCYACTPDTWHWDNVAITNAIPFTLIHGDRRELTRTDANPVLNFEKPAPSDAWLRFTAMAGSLDVSFDNGVTWQPAQVKQPQQLKSRAYFWSYWTPIPQGAQSVRFRGTSYYGNGWVVRDGTIWSLNAP